MTCADIHWIVMQCAVICGNALHTGVKRGCAKQCAPAQIDVPCCDAGAPPCTAVLLPPAAAYCCLLRGGAAHCELVAETASRNCTLLITACMRLCAANDRGAQLWLARARSCGVV